LGLSQELEDRVVLNEAIESCRSHDYNELILEQIKKDCLGNDLFEEADGDERNEVRL
jgi:hypothetical protein